jgi:uncharacterized protein
METEAHPRNSRTSKLGLARYNALNSSALNSAYFRFFRVQLVVLAAVLSAGLRCSAGTADERVARLADLRQRAEAGDPAAQIQIGELYFAGEKAPFDKAEAARWYRMAADQGNPKAAFLLGFMYEVGDGVARYKVEAAKWYRQAAESGDARAQFLLASMYARGDGVARDSVESATWLLKAAQQGHPQAQAALLKRYYSGENLFGGKEESVKWFRNAAKQGHAFAQFQLGLMYSLGNGVPKDDVEALAWLNLSASTGDHDYVKARDTLQAELGHSVAVQGQERSRELLKQVDIAAAAKDSAVVAQDGQ